MVVYVSSLWTGLRLSSFILLAVKSVWQYYVPSREVLLLLDMFRRMVNESIRIGLMNDAHSLKRLSPLSYNQLAHYDSPSYYKLCAISRAAGILASRKKRSQERLLDQRALCCQTTARLLLWFQGQEWRVRDSHIKRKTFQGSVNLSLDKLACSHRL